MRTKVTWTLISMPRTRSSGIDQLIRGLLSCRVRWGGGRHSVSAAPWHQLAQRSERRAELFREELRFFPGGEVATPLDLVEVGEAGVDRLDPAAGGSPDLAGERREANRHGDRRRSLAARK